MVYQFKFGDETITSNSYGGRYIEELIDLVTRFAPQDPKNILEWGNGITSLAIVDLARQWQAEAFVMIDNYKPYQDAIFSETEIPPFVSQYCPDINGASNGQTDKGFNYSTLPLSLNKIFDLIIIDGRRRVECAYIASLISHEETLILMHDYRRTRYQPVLGLFEVVEDGAQFRAYRVRRELVGPLAAGRERVAAGIAVRESAR